MIERDSLAALERGYAFESGRHPEEAYAAYLEATALDPENGCAWRQLGNLLRGAGRLAEASECFSRAIAAGDDRALNGFFLSACGVGPVAPRAPAGFVVSLYDQYAARFDEHLVQELGYRAPQVLTELITADRSAAFESALDLGCGSGLLGLQLAPHAGRIDGVDLSAEMLAKATQTGVYDRLTLADLQQHLQTSAQRYDLVACCDSFIYIGDLQAVFAGVRRVLDAQGHFAFTVESCEAELGYDLLPTLRFAHSEAFIRRLAAAQGLTVHAAARGVFRQQNDGPVEGLLFDLVRD